MATVFRPLAADLTQMRREMDSLVQSFLAAGGTAAAWSPRADIIETETAYHVAADLPGVDRETLELTLDDGVLKISGERTLGEAFQQGRFHRVERAYGRFARSFRLGSEVDTDAVEADFDDGVLHVTVRKAEQPAPRRIEVRSGTQARLSQTNNSTDDATADDAATVHEDAVEA